MLLNESSYYLLSFGSYYYYFLLNEKHLETLFVRYFMFVFTIGITMELCNFNLFKEI